MGKGNKILVPLLVLGGFLAFTKREEIEDVADQIVLSFMPAQFIIKYFKDALDAQKVSGVPFLVTLAQAGLESNWGKSAPGFNFFGHKVGSTWTGETQKLKTWECGSSGDAVKDRIKDEVIQIFPPGSPAGNSSCNAKGFYSYRVYGKFRKYPSAKDAFIAHGLFLKNNKRYERAFFTKTPEAFITEVARAGYATDPTYAQKNINLFDSIRTIITKNKLA